MGAVIKTRVIVIGAGQAGLSASFYLTQFGIDHVLLERKKLGEAWRSQRWDSFRLVLPNWTLNLPGFPYKGSEPNGFLSRLEIVKFLEEFANSFSPPLQEEVEVLELVQLGDKKYQAITTKGIFEAFQVIVATGPFQKPHIPFFANEVTKKVSQIHSNEYRSHEKLPAGNVLVVGSGQSGAQIAEEIHSSKRKVFLAVSHCSRVPRQFREKDFAWWRSLPEGAWSQNVNNHPDPNAKFQCSSLLSGQNGGEEINLREFANRGINLVGRISGMKTQETFSIIPDLNSNLNYADVEYLKILEEWRRIAQKLSLTLPLEINQVQLPSKPINEVEVLSIVENNITSVIWATGYKYAFDWIKLPVFDPKGFPKHSRGEAQPGLFFLGLPWQHKRTSALLVGVAEDAKHIVEQISSMPIDETSKTRT